MLIQKWLTGELCSLETMLVDAVPVAECNLECAHCFWPHQLRSPEDGETWEAQAEEIAGMNVPVVYAGRILNQRGERFIEECFRLGVPVGIVDNGYTIFRRPEFLPRYTHINISLDGAPAAHDRQRGKKGSFMVAWSAIMKLKSMGYDPIVSAAFSPISAPTWGELEAMLIEHDIPMSCSLVLPYPENQKVERGVITFAEGIEVERAFACLIEGMPKLVNLYDLRYVEMLKGILGKLRWEVAEAGDSLVAEANGSYVHYYPDSVVAAKDKVLRWDGKFYIPWGKGFIKEEELSPERLNELNKQELTVWNGLL